MNPGVLFFMLLCGHALADYPLQGPYLSIAKRRQSAEGAGGVWVHALSAHALIHGGVVALITGYPLLGLAEAVAHAMIDFAKCEKKIGFHTDQALHVLCKALIVMVIWRAKA